MTTARLLIINGNVNKPQALPVALHNRTYDELLAENKRKAIVDWEKKIVLPEVKEAFSERHKILLEHCNKLPEKYLR